MDLQALKRRALVTHNKSLPEQARDAELLEVIAALERAVELLYHQTDNSAYDDTCPECAATVDFLAAFHPPGGEGT